MTIQKALLYFTLLISLAGCGSLGKSLKSLVGGKPAPDVDVSQYKNQRPKYSQQKNLPYYSSRQYKRLTREKLEQQAYLEDKKGSLWVEEGQGSYLFSQNLVRKPGDVLNVVLDGEPRSQLQTKAGVISNLIERQNLRRKLASVPNNPEAKKAAKAAIEAKKKKKEEKDALALQRIPARIVSSLPDGSYRVKGSQTFMINRFEHKIIVTGLVRPSDIGDDSIQASQMLDSKFDIVRIKRGKL